MAPAVASPTSRRFETTCSWRCFTNRTAGVLWLPRAGRRLTSSSTCRCLRAPLPTRTVTARRGPMGAGHSRRGGRTRRRRKRRGTTISRQRKRGGGKEGLRTSTLLGFSAWREMTMPLWRRFKAGFGAVRSTNTRGTSMVNAIERSGVAAGGVGSKSASAPPGILTGQVEGTGNASTGAAIAIATTVTAIIAADDDVAGGGTRTVTVARDQAQATARGQRERRRNNGGGGKKGNARRRRRSERRRRNESKRRSANVASGKRSEGNERSEGIAAAAASRTADSRSRHPPHPPRLHRRQSRRRPLHRSRPPTRRRHRVRAPRCWFGLNVGGFSPTLPQGKG